MNAAQMIAHIQRLLKVVFGELKLKKSLVGILFGAIGKKQLAGEKPFKKKICQSIKYSKFPEEPHFEEEKKN